MSRLLRQDRGASLVEFALVFPVLFLVVMTTVTVLWMLAARSTLTGVARDGARYASIRVDPFVCDLDCDGERAFEHARFPAAADVAEFVNERTGPFGDVSVTVDPAGEDRLPNSVITVRVSRPLPVIVQPVASLFGWDELEYESEAMVRAE